MNDPYRTPGEVEMDIDIPKKRDWGDIGKLSFWITLFASFAISLVALASWLSYKTITSSGKSDFCYVELSRTSGLVNGEYNLMQHVPWQRDRTLVIGLKTSEDVRKEAEKFGCAIR